MKWLAALLLPLALLSLAVACEEEKEEAATATPSPAATATATPQASPTLDLTPTLEAAPTPAAPVTPTVALPSPSPTAALTIPAMATPELPEQPGGPSVKLAFAGDTHGHNIVDDPSLEGHPLLAGVNEVLEDADLVVFNHEGVLIEDDDARAYCRTFQMQSTFASLPSFAERLGLGPRAVASLANNHAMDCGPEGLAQTLKAFKEAGILTVGAGSNLGEACQPVELTLNGVDIALLSYLLQDPSTMEVDIAATEQSPGVATMAGCDAETAVRALADEHVVVVSLHTHVGSSWTYATAAEHLAAVRQLLDWGADVVVSHGPHFPQGVLLEANGVGLLSLGNFMFRPDYTMPPDAHQGLLGLLEVSDEGVVETRLYPIEVTGEGLPVLAEKAASGKILALIGRLSDDYGTTIAVQDGFGLVELGGRQSQGGTSPTSTPSPTANAFSDTNGLAAEPKTRYGIHVP
jgi:poly-gamma-glutamate capsule biosynthesis protein CapA/YwtB (metallophosphatase superfamily)